MCVEGGTTLFWTLIPESHWSHPHASPSLPHLEVTPAQSQREQKRAAHQRLFLVSQELKDPWNKPPGSRHSAFLTVCSFEGIFKAASERGKKKCACHLGGRHFPFLCRWQKYRGNGGDKIRQGSVPASRSNVCQRSVWVFCLNVVRAAPGSRHCFSGSNYGISHLNFTRAIKRALSDVRVATWIFSATTCISEAIRGGYAQTLFPGLLGDRESSPLMEVQGWWGRGTEFPFPFSDLCSAGRCVWFTFTLKRTWENLSFHISLLVLMDSLVSTWMASVSSGSVVAYRRWVDAHVQSTL